jgi:energy-coupling factor transporter ATP-binding protein EcfA2
MYVTNIHLENLKRPDGSFAGWTVFVGGNSSGKSTLLKGIALALLGPESGRQLLGQTAGWILKTEKRATATATIGWNADHDSFKKGGKHPGATFEAGVRWYFEKPTDEIPQFRAVDKRNARGTREQMPERGPWNSNSYGWFSAGYGPMRRLTGSSSESMRYTVSKEIESRFVTLFREDAALSESEEWLRKTHSRTLESSDPDQETLLTGVKDLLGDGLLPHGMKISRVTVDDVFIQDRRGLELPMRDISDGCRSVYATILDLIHGMYEVYGAENLFAKDAAGKPFVTRPGVVIIDEIEAHLHPQWQKEIPYWLKTHFPKIQFLVSSHSPLIAQAADPNGLFVLPLQDEVDREPRPLTDKEFERIRWGKAEKTLLGVAFGLRTTRSKWANQRVEHWKRLDAKKRAGQTLRGADASEYKELKTQLDFALEPVSEL